MDNRNYVYWCQEYFTKNAGFNTHATEFFENFKRLPEVDHCSVFSHLETSPVAAGTPQTPRNGRCRALKAALLEALRYFKPRRKETAKLIEHLQHVQAGTCIMRTNPANVGSLSLLKASRPDVHICLEVNAPVMMEGSALPNVFRRWLQRWEARRFEHYADSICVISKHIQTHYIRHGVQADKLAVNYNGVNPEMFSRNPGPERKHVLAQYELDTSSFVLGYTGGMEAWRRIPEWMALVLEYMRTHPDVVLVLVGEGEDTPRIEALVRREKQSVQQRVLRLGWIPQKDLSVVMGAFDLALYPFFGLSHGSPQKLFEYLGMGLPTIGPKVAAIQEVFTSGEHCLLAEQDGSDLLALIGQVKEDPAFARGVSERGKQYVLDNFTWSDNARRVWEHIHRNPV